MWGKKYWTYGFFIFCPPSFAKPVLCPRYRVTGRRNSDRRDEGETWRAKNIGTSGLLIFCPPSFAKPDPSFAKPDLCPRYRVTVGVARTEEMRAKNVGQKIFGPKSCVSFALHFLPDRFAVRAVV